MTLEKLQAILDLARELKTYLVVETISKVRKFIDFSNEEYDDTFIDDKSCLCVWNTGHNTWDIILLEKIEFVELY